MRRILVVDDEPSIRFLLESALDGIAEIVAVEDGEQALAAVAEERPSLVILDVVMPGMDGLEVLRRWREDPETEDLEVILLSGLTEVADQERGYRAGADAYLTKPVDIEVLESLVVAMITEQES